MRGQSSENCILFDSRPRWRWLRQDSNLPANREFPDAGELTIVSEPAGTRGYDDLRRWANCEPLAQGVRPSVASISDHARMLAALDREQDLESLGTLRRLIELEHECSRGGSIER